MDAYWTDSANEMIAFLDPDNERQLHILKGDLVGLRNSLKGTRFEAMEGPRARDGSGDCNHLDEETRC